MGYICADFDLPDGFGDELLPLGLVYQLESVADDLDSLFLEPGL